MSCVPSFTSPLSIYVSANNPFYYDINASCCPVSFSATDLPSGLQLDTQTGIVTGSISTPGLYNVTITATTIDDSVTATLAINVS